ncbi:hypothetical protein BIW11_05008, partial [Tropilaelaps mercedesae]
MKNRYLGVIVLETSSPVSLRESSVVVVVFCNPPFSDCRFLVSFMVDARGGAMRGCRHSGVRVIIPPRRASMPMRVTCRFIRKEKLAHPPPLMEGEACAARIIEMGPASAKFLGPVVIEVPHFASLRGKEREIVILRSDNGESWKEHTTEATEDAVSEVLNGSFDAQELNAMQDFNTNRVTRILTTDFPQYFAVVCRNRQEVHSIGPEGGMVSSTVVSQVQAIFPDGALTKKIKVGLQVNKKKKQTVDQQRDSHLADTETLSDDLSIEPKKPRFGEKRPSDSTTVDIHEGVVVAPKEVTKTTAMTASFRPFGRSKKMNKAEPLAVAERPAKEDGDEQGPSTQSVPEIELPTDNVSDVATVVCESPLKSHTLSCSTPRPIGDSVVEELAISLMTFLNEDKLTHDDETEGSSQRKATPEPSPSGSLLARLTPSMKRHIEQASDVDEVPSSPKKQRLFRSRVLYRGKGKARKVGKNSPAKLPSPERLVLAEAEKVESKSVRSENLEVPNIIKNTQSMESIDLNSDTQSRKESATEVVKADTDDVQNVSQKKGFLMRLGRHRVASVGKVATDTEPTTPVGGVDQTAEPPLSDLEHSAKTSIVRRFRRQKSSSDTESAQDAANDVPVGGAKERRKKKAARPSDRLKVFSIFKKREHDGDVIIAEEPRGGEVEASAEVRTCEAEHRDENGDAKSDDAEKPSREEKSAKDDPKSESSPDPKGDQSEDKSVKRRKKKVLFSRFTMQRTNTDKQKKDSSASVDAAEG